MSLFHCGIRLHTSNILVPCLQNVYAFCLLCWTGIFKIEDSQRVAKLWGMRKNRPAMNYDKLSRSIRQYYKKGIIKKTDNSKRLVYQFCAAYLWKSTLILVQGQSHKTSFLWRLVAENERIRVNRREFVYASSRMRQQCLDFTAVSGSSRCASKYLAPRADNTSRAHDPNLWPQTKVQSVTDKQLKKKREDSISVWQTRIVF